MFFAGQFIRQLLIEVIVSLIEFCHVIHTHISGRFRHVVYYLLQGTAPCIVIIHKGSYVTVSRDPRQGLAYVGHAVQYTAVMLRGVLSHTCQPGKEVHESLEYYYLVTCDFLTHLTVGIKGRDVTRGASFADAGAEDISAGIVLEAYGDSMVDIGVDEGDLILVKKATTASDGDVIVALTEDGNTLKRLFWENGRPRLHAENKTYSKEKRDIYPGELVIQGIALKVIKDIR